MATLRNPNKEKFTIIDNYIFRESQLSLKAMGMLCYLISLPDYWEFSERGLKAVLKADGLTSIKSALKELEEKGFLEREQVRDADGGFGKMVYTIREIPENRINTEKQPRTQNPTTVKPSTQNQLQINTKRINTKKTKESIYPGINVYSIEKTRIDGIEYFKNIIYKNINADTIICDRPGQKQQVNELISIMAEILASKKTYTMISGNKLLTSDVKQVFNAINQGHIEYVLESLENNYTAIKNIKGYLLTTIYNAPQTIGNYYANRVRNEIYAK